VAGIRIGILGPLEVTVSGEPIEISAMQLRRFLCLLLIAPGRPVPTSVVLEQLVREHPLRERFWAQLMLALYRCGRQAEALRAYQRLRTTLVEQIGLDPTHELVDLEAAVLRHDPSLDYRHPAPQEPQPSNRGSGRETGRQVAENERANNNLPIMLTSLVGRQRELTEVLGLLSHSRLVTLIGVGGVGKTRLAMRAAAELSGGLDGVFRADLASVGEPAEVPRCIASAL
jgi:hypothetical protein